MKKRLLLILMAVTSVTAFGQGVLISPNVGTPDPSAVLDLNAPNKGFLMSRLTTSQRNAIVSPAIGLQIYNTTTNCLQIYMPNGWKDVSCDNNCISLPNAAFNLPNGPFNVGVNYTFQAQAGGLLYSWTFPGGTPGVSAVQNPVVQWANAGTYTITLVVTDQNGCVDSSNQTITIVSNLCDPNPPGTLLIPSSGFCDPNPPSGWTQCAGWINTNADDVTNGVLDGCLNSNSRLRIKVWNVSSGVLEEDVFSTNTNMTAWNSWNYHGGSITKNTFTFWTGSTDYFSSNGGGSACYFVSNCGVDAPCFTLTLGTGNASSVILAPGATNEFEYRVNCNGQALPGRIIAVYK